MNPFCLALKRNALIYDLSFVNRSSTKTNNLTPNIPCNKYRLPPLCHQMGASTISLSTLMDSNGFHDYS